MKIVVLQCKKCKTETPFNHPTTWLRVFIKRFGDYELIDKYVDVDDYNCGCHQVEKKAQYGYYTCSKCKKK